MFLFKVDSREQLRNVTRMKLYKYRFSREFLEHAGLSGDDEDPTDTGVLAQDLKEVLPDAVREAVSMIFVRRQKLKFQRVAFLIDHFGICSYR